MGHQNTTRFIGRTSEMAAAHQNHGYPPPPPEPPCVFYPNMMAGPTSVRALVPGGFHFGVSQQQLNGVDLNAPPPPLGYYAPYLAPAGGDLPHVDAFGAAFKRKHQYSNNASVGPNFSILPAPPFEYVGGEPVLVQNTGRLMMMPADYNSVPLVQVPVRSSNADVLWRPLPSPYFHGSIETVAHHRYQASIGGFHYSPQHIVHPNPPPLNVQGYNSNLSQPSRMLLPSGAMFMAPSGFQLYQQPRGRDNTVAESSSELWDNTPHIRVLPEDEIAVLEIPVYHDPVDRHSDMRLDIDHMSYEELLALGDQIGRVGTGFSEDFIRNNLKTRTFADSSASHHDLEKPVCTDQQIDFCVICQSNYEDKEALGRADCGHEYHSDCLKKWLLIKNTCPICKSPALGSSSKAKN